MAELQTGKPTPLGASFDGQGVNFALFSADAERVELCIFDDRQQEQRIELTARSGDIWHGYLPDAQPGLRYGFGSMDRSSRRRGCASIRISCCWIRAPASLMAG